MIHPFETFKPDYENLLASMVVTRQSAVDDAAREVLANMSRYLAVERITNVPAALIGCLNLRESDQNFRMGLGQGDPWNKVSTHVPVGFGPFKSWEDAAVFYIHYDHLDDNSRPWTMPYVCWKAEVWNGFGPRGHGIHSGYLWAGTNHYVAGKYVSDHNWKASEVDHQLGVIPVMIRMFELRGDLKPGLHSIPIVPVAHNLVPDLTQTRPLQMDLNKLGANLVVDGNYGRRTREAVRAFQVKHKLIPDGIAGPITREAIGRALTG